MICKVLWLNVSEHLGLYYRQCRTEHCGLKTKEEEEPQGFASPRACIRFFSDMWSHCCWTFVGSGGVTRDINCGCARRLLYETFSIVRFEFSALIYTLFHVSVLHHWLQTYSLIENICGDSSTWTAGSNKTKNEGNVTISFINFW